MFLTIRDSLCIVFNKMIGKVKQMKKGLQKKPVYSDDELTDFSEPMSYQDMIKKLKE
jgi:hypothetical protein